MEETALIEVQPVHCHKRLDRNTLVRGIRVISEDESRCELALKFDHRALDFFFDHDIDHLPGMLLICGMRQGALALAHLVYGVPPDFIAMIKWLEIQFFNYAELDTETRVLSRLIDRSEQNGRFELVLDGVMMQGDVPILQMKGSLIALRPDLAGKIRRRKTEKPANLLAWVEADRENAR